MVSIRQPGSTPCRQAPPGGVSGSSGSGRQFSRRRIGLVGATSSPPRRWVSTRWGGRRGRRSVSVSMSATAHGAAFSSCVRRPKYRSALEPARRPCVPLLGAAEAPDLPLTCVGGHFLGISHRLRRLVLRALRHPVEQAGHSRE